MSFIKRSEVTLLKCYWCQRKWEREIGIGARKSLDFYKIWDTSPQMAELWQIPISLARSLSPKWNKNNTAVKNSLSGPRFAHRPCQLRSFFFGACIECSYLSRSLFVFLRWLQPLLLLLLLQKSDAPWALEGNGTNRERYVSPSSRDTSRSSLREVGSLSCLSVGWVFNLRENTVYCYSRRQLWSGPVL